MQVNRQGQPDAPGISFFRGVLLGVTLLCFALGTYAPAAGQAAVTLTVDAPQTEAFPEVAVAFKLTDGTGLPIRPLEADQLTVIENEQELPVNSLSEAYRGVYFTLVVNGDREMDLRDATGLSRYEKLVDALQIWVSGWHFSGEDAWSLMTNEGLEISAASDAVAWMTALDAYQPNFRQVEPDLTGLEEAIQMLQKAEAPFGVDRSLLYITPPPTPDQIEGVTALAEQARQAGIQVNIWMVGEALYLGNDQGGALIEMAATTGGQFFHYTGAEAIPDLNNALADLGYAAQLTYNSALRASGSYPLAIRAALPELDVTGEAQPFYVDVLPPNPMLLAPPVSVTREALPDTEDEAAVLLPAEVVVQILIEFPDGRPRDLTASRLLVDGSVAAVNTQAPFDSFTWDLSELTETGEHTIQVEVEDALGLSAATLLTPVQIEILEPENAARFSLQQIALFAAGGVAGAGLILLAVWLARKFWRANQPRWASRHSEAQAVAARPPAPPRGEARRYATLLPLGVILEPGEDAGLPITRPRVLLGSDPHQADLHLDAPGVDPVQAELICAEDGFWLRHLGASNPTWCNYQEVGPERVPLKAGDILHFGDCGFRFTINDDTVLHKVSVTRYEPF